MAQSVSLTVHVACFGYKSAWRDVTVLVPGETSLADATSLAVKEAEMISHSQEFYAASKSGSGTRQWIIVDDTGDCLYDTVASLVDYAFRRKLRESHHLPGACLKCQILCPCVCCTWGRVSNSPLS